MGELQLGRSKTAARRRTARKTLVPAFSCDPSEPIIPLAHALSEGRQVIVLGIVLVEVSRSLSEAATQTQELRTKLRKAVANLGGRLWPKIVASHHPEYEITSFTAEQNADLMVLPWLNKPSIYNAMVEAVIERASCNLAVLQGSPPKPKGNILVVLRVGPDSELALRLGLNLARSGDHTITTLRPTGMADVELDENATLGLDQVLQHLPQVQDAVLLADDPGQAILEQVEHFDLVIVGASERNENTGSCIDELTRRLLDKSPCPVIVARAQTHLAPAPPSDLTGLEAISILVDKWFAENTFRASEFDELQRLLKRKESLDVTISLALPALNEEETVGNVIETIQRALMAEVPLLDEIVLIDSNSVDHTREIANNLGIPVYIHQEILPQYGARPGKGEALWKSLYVTQGDIVLWIDTDIVNIHPRFVYGLIGPLLYRPNLMFIKGFYLRPIRVGKTIQAGGGGRVTELTARPLLNLFYPALSGLIQPLSGEYGGRRLALEQVPFSSGYGVEIGLLIDILEQFGLDAIGQVDLIRRVHHHQPLAALSLMAFAVIQTVIRKLDRRYGLQLLRDVNRAMKLIRHEDKRFFLKVEELAERQRPPMSSLPEYQTRFKRNT